MKKENRRTQMTKKILKNSLLELLEQQDIQKISIRSLCELADLNRSTFYKYYGSQYDLLKEMENDLLNQIEMVVSKDATISVNDNRLESILKFMKDNLKLSKILINSNADVNFQKQVLGLPSIMERLQSLKNEYGEHESSYAQTLILYGGYHIVMQWLGNDCKESPHEMAGIIEHLIKKIVPVSDFTQNVEDSKIYNHLNPSSNSPT